jgi:hypothetical protein
MLKRMLAMSLTVGLAVGVLMSCGGSTPVPPNPGNGSLYLFLGDAPLCDILSMRVTLTGASVITQTGGNKVSLYPTNSPPYTKLNIASLRDFSTVLNLGGVAEGTYNEIELSLGVPQIVVYDPTQSPPTKVVSASISTAGPIIPIQPALVVTKNKLSALRLDFDMRQSVEVDGQGQVTGKVTPVITATPVDGSGAQGFGAFEDLVGFVRSVSSNNTTTDTSLTGNFTLQLLSGSGPQITVNLNSSTQLLGVPGLNELLTGSFVEVDGSIDSNGNFVANTAEVEDREDLDQKKLAYLGFITSLTKDSNGNLTQFQLFVRETEPGSDVDVPPDSTVTVDVSSSTAFQFSSRPVNFANLTFDPTALAVGQEVVVHGTFTKVTDQPTTVAADKVYLKLQSFQGSLFSLLQAGSDDRTGAFQLAPCCTLLQGAPIYVLTNNQTTFVSLSGLSALTPQRLLLVKGLPFFETAAGTINGVPVPAGTLVMLAKQVHQLQ